MSGRFGFELLRTQVLENVESDMECFMSERFGDSEIERLFFSAFYARIRFQENEYTCLGLIESSMDRDSIMLGADKRMVLIERQVPIKDWRVDFVIYAWTSGTIWSGGKHEDGEARWRKLVVECDGHDFHERTKKQAARDRSRDRAISMLGYDVFRFTGSELWRDPLGCADQVYDWAVRGV